jgi:predicted metal-dependent HD superfamily phosphohydrolase
MMPPDGHTSDVDLLSEWAATLRRLNAFADAGHDPARLGLTVITRYTETHRRFHTLDHLAAVLVVVDDLAGCADRPDIVRLAAWYHDAVYDPRRADNEVRSAELAAAELQQAGLPPATAGRVAELVLVTATHDPPAGDRDGAVLCDADLAVLASPAAEYERYVAAVRQEYAHVDDAAWHRGRTDVLSALIALPQLYRTPPARRWEPQARANLNRELADLRGP